MRDTPSIETHVIWLLVGEMLELREALTHEIPADSLRQEVLLVILVVYIARWGVRRDLRPLRQLSETVTSRDTDELASLPQQGLPAEVAPLVEAINQYMTRLLRLVHARKRFFADTAHQLKTPLAVIQTQSELALRESNGEHIRRHLEPLHGTVRQTARGVQQLLSSSHLETDSGYAPQLQPLRPDTLAGDMALKLAPVARKSSVDLGFKGESVTMAGKPQWLQELASNLLDNAILYTSKGAHVTLWVRRQAMPMLGEQAVLQVEDSSPGIAVPERDAVFGRFYHGVAPGGHDSSGLGLAIVREIAHLYGSTVTLSDTPGGGLAVSVYPTLALSEEHPA